MKKTILALALTVISLPSLANDFVNKEIAAATIKTLPGLTESDIVFAKHDKESNFNVVRLKTGQVLYGDQNLKHFIVGDSYSRNSILASDEITGELYNHTSSLYSDFHKSIFDNLTGYGVQAKSKDELIKVKVFLSLDVDIAISFMTMNKSILMLALVLNTSRIQFMTVKKSYHPKLSLT